MKYKLTTYSKKLLADTLTPVNIYLKLRDVFAGSILLESSDYHGHENSLSFICCDPIASFQVSGSKGEVRYPDGTESGFELSRTGDAVEELEKFRRVFSYAGGEAKLQMVGLFGYI